MKTESRIRLAAPQFVLWAPVFALAALCGSVTLSWAVYQAHLPGLLTQFGVSAEYGTSVGIIATSLAIALDPLMGRLADRTEWRRGKRFPLISCGVMLASAGFIVIPLVAGLMKNPGGNGRWVLPGLLLAWAIAITLVRSPALALMRRYASPRQLPRAASVLTLSIAMMAALSLAADEWIKTLGAPITFTIAATALLLSTAWLRSHSLPITAPKTDTPNGDTSGLIHPTPLLPLGFIFGLGLFMTLALRLIANGFSSLLTVQLPFNLPPIGWVLISLAIAAIPAGSLAMRLNNRKTMLLGLGLTAASLGLSAISVDLVEANQRLAIALSILLGIALSLVVNGILPLILSSVPSRNAGFATGTFFSGVAAATLGMTWFFERGHSFSALMWLGGAIAALVASGGCVVMSRVALQSLKPTKDYQSL